MSQRGCRTSGPRPDRRVTLLQLYAAPPSHFQLTFGPCRIRFPLLMSKTLFEKIIAREIPATILYEDELVLAFRANARNVDEGLLEHGYLFSNGQYLL